MLALMNGAVMCILDWHQYSINYSTNDRRELTV